MKTPHPLHRAGLSLGATLCLLATTATAADNTALQRCRAITEASARLACYDALPLPAALVAAPAAASPNASPSAVASTAPSARPPGLAPAAAPGGAALAAAPAVAPAAVQSFGQERRDEPQAISSHITGVFEGWGPTSRIKLANGQVWQVIDGSEGVYFLQSPKVTVRRALLGGFQLDIEGAKRTPKVRRVE